MEHCVSSHTHECCYYTIVVRAFGEARCHRSRAGGGSGLSSGCDMLITGALSAIVHAGSSEQGGFRRGGGSA